MDIEKASSLCRICLQEGATTPIFDEVDFENSILTKIKKCFTEEIQEEIGFPKNICTECNTTLDFLCKFITKFENSSKILRDSIHCVKTEICEYNENDSDFNLHNEESIYIKLENDEKTEEVTATYVLEKLKPLSDLRVTKVTKNSTAKAKKKITVKNKVADSILEGDFVWSGDKWCLQKGKTKIKKEIPIKQKERTIYHEQKQKEKIKVKEKADKLCNVCGNVFKELHKLNTHMATAHSNEKFTCTICYKEYRSKINLKDHTRRFHGEKKNKCTMCPMKFVCKSVLTKHINQVHNKHLIPKKYYSCKLCNKTYKCKKSVLLHERSFHTGFRPAECQVCFKTFYHEDYLKEHMRIHTGELPFKCPICGRGCTQLGNMKSHLRVHKVSELNETIRSKMKPSYMRFLKKC